MKNATFIALLLTLIMLILVVGASALFLQQGREELLDERATLAAEVNGLEAELADREGDIVVLQSQAGSQGPALATSDALLQTRSAEAEANAAAMREASATRDVLSAQATTEAAPTATATLVPPPTWTPRPEPSPTVAPDTPFLAIAIPRAGEEIDGSAFQLVALGASANGVEEFIIVVNEGEPIVERIPGNLSHHTLERTIESASLQLGENTVEVTVVDSTGQRNTVTTTFNVVGLDPGEDESDT